MRDVALEAHVFGDRLEVLRAWQRDAFHDHVYRVAHGDRRSLAETEGGAESRHLRRERALRALAARCGLDVALAPRPREQLVVLARPRVALGHRRVDFALAGLAGDLLGHDR